MNMSCLPFPAQIQHQLCDISTVRTQPHIQRRIHPHAPHLHIHIHAYIYDIQQIVKVLVTGSECLLDDFLFQQIVNIDSKQHTALIYTIIYTYICYNMTENAKVKVG